MSINSADEKPTANNSSLPTTSKSSKSTQYVEAQGWIINELGEVNLTAMPDNSSQTSVFSGNE